MNKLRTITIRALLTVAAVFAVLPSSAQSTVGGTDYDWGVNGLVHMTSFVTTMMTYTMELVFAIAGSVSVIGALNVYIKMNTGQEGISKSIMMLIGAVIFMIAATIVMPAFFGFQYSGKVWSY